MSTTKLLGVRHWSILDMQKLLFASGSQNTRRIPSALTTVRFNSSRANDLPRHGKAINGSSDSNRYNSSRPSSRTEYQPNHRDGPRTQYKNRASAGNSTYRPPMPSNFRSVPDTERIEGIEKQAAQQFFIKKLGTSTVTNDCFSIKAARMPFREPPAREIPPFVQKAIIEHEYATAKYNEDLLEYEQWRIGNSSKEETVDPSNPPMTKSLIRKPEPPMKPPFLVQHELRSVRQYPSSIDSSHPSFRVTFIIAKKTISKLAVHRNLCRKKLSAAVETVFRKHARRGNEFMIFAKKPCVTTPQWKLNELMKEALSNSRLYGDRSSRIADTESNSSENGDTVTSDRGLPKIRWKNNRPPAHREWWRHALPNPLGRIQQTNSFLDQYCPKDERPAEFNKNQNPRKID